jgi:hypothetical protein
MHLLHELFVGEFGKNDVVFGHGGASRFFFNAIPVAPGMRLPDRKLNLKFVKNSFRLRRGGSEKRRWQTSDGKADVCMTQVVGA